MRPERLPVTVELIKAAYAVRRQQIRARLSEFSALWASGSDEVFFEELVYCIFTAGASARMGLKAVAAVRPLLASASERRLTTKLLGVHRYPAARASYIVHTRNFLRADCGFRLRERFAGFADQFELRAWLAREKGVKGLGYKEASHFLRNIGMTGFAILDKHILRCMYELGACDSPLPIANGKRYMDTEQRLRRLADELEIDFDELDLLLWSMKAGEILK